MPTKETNRQTDKQTNRQTGKQSMKKTHKQIDKQAHWKTNRQINKHSLRLHKHNFKRTGKIQLRNKNRQKHRGKKCQSK